MYIKVGVLPPPPSVLAPITPPTYAQYIDDDEDLYIDNDGNYYRDDG